MGRRVGSPEDSRWVKGLWLHLDTAQVSFCTSWKGLVNK